MTIALVGNGNLAGGVNGGTSSAFNTSGANFIAIHLARYSFGTVTAPTDSKGNTYTGLTQQVNTGVLSKIYYCLAPTVGSSHTFTIADLASYATAEIVWFSGVAVASALDIQNGSGSATPGSVTPNQNNSLIVTGFCTNGAGSYTASGFTVSDAQSYNVGITEGGGFAYLIQTTAGAANPTWSGGSVDQASTIAVFKPTILSGSIFRQSLLNGISAGGKFFANILG